MGAHGDDIKVAVKIRDVSIVVELSCLQNCENYGLKFINLFHLFELQSSTYFIEVSVNNEDDQHAI